jgi:hypothetical protein
MGQNVNRANEVLPVRSSAYSSSGRFETTKAQSHNGYAPGRFRGHALAVTPGRTRHDGLKLSGSTNSYSPGDFVAGS